LISRNCAASVFSGRDFSADRLRAGRPATQRALGPRFASVCTPPTFEEEGGETLIVMHELYPSKKALDAAIAGMEGAMPDTASLRVVRMSSAT
jgi:hypothetical protein